MSKNAFVKGLGLFDATMIVAGTMIGSGIFIVSSGIAQDVGSGWLLLSVWAITGLMTVIGALSYGELAASMPEAGGVYVYLKKAWNSLTGFLFGWALLMVIQTGTIAAVAVAFAKAVGVIVPWINAQSCVVNWAGIHCISTEQVLAIASILLLTWVNARGVKTGALVQNVLTVAKVLALLGLVVLGLFFLNGHIYNDVSVLSSTVTSAGTQGYLFGIGSILAISMVGALFSSDAWFGVTYVAGEVRNPSKNLPLALFLGTAIVSLLYILANIAYINILGMQGMQQVAAQDTIVATSALNVVFGANAAKIMALVIMISTIGCNNGLIMSGARVFWAMAKDKLFFKAAGVLNEKTKVPVNALFLQAFWAGMLCLSGKYSQILDYVICAGLVFYILTILSIFRLRRTNPNLNRPYKAFGYPVLPALYVVLAFFIVINLLLYKPLYCWPGIIIVASGIPVYFVWKKLADKEGDETNEEQLQSVV